MRMKRIQAESPKAANILVALDLTHQSGREHLAGFYRYADQQQNWRVRLVPSTEPSYLPMVEKILAGGVDGAIMKGECVLELADAIRASSAPVVSIDKPQVDRDDVADVFICNDNALIGLEAARHFDSLGRFAAYGFVPDPNGCEWSRVRGEAFCREAKAKHPDAEVCTAGDDLKSWIAELPKPAAVFAAFDQAAANVLETCRDLRIGVPRNALVLGVDDDALICDHTVPKLSSIKPDHEEQGFQAAHALDRLISGWKPAKGKTIVCPHLRISERDTTVTVPPAVHLVNQITAYLNENALKEIRVADVVRHVGVSSRLANLRFSQMKGCSIQEELVKRRLAEARRLLRTTTWSMSRIASRCGFKSQIVLAHLFKSRFGKSMSDWRSDVRAQGT